MRRPATILLSGVLATGALVMSGCGSSTSPKTASSDVTEVHVTLSEFNVSLDRTSIPQGPVKFIIDNGGSRLHELVLEPAGVADMPFEVNNKASELEDITAGTKGALFQWTIDTPGKYQVACHVTDGVDHYVKGMVATFTVNAA